MDACDRPTVVDELCGHLTAFEMMKLTRRLRDEEEERRFAALYGELTTTSVEDES